MGVLHILSKNPEKISDLEVHVATLSSEDALLLIADGVYATVYMDANSPLAIAQGVNNNFFALLEDMRARGLSDLTNSFNFQTISYQDFVDLVEKHQSTYNWA